LNFFNCSTKVNLPNFIEKFIKDELPEDYQYHYFKENPEEIYANISICFNMRYLSLLIEGVKKCPDIFPPNNTKADKLEKAYDKLSDEDIFKEILKIDKKLLDNYLKDNKEKSKSKEKDADIEIYYLHFDKAIEEKYEILFKLDNKIANFYIDLKKEEKKKPLKEEEKNIIKIKNYLSSSLGNYRLLNIADLIKNQHLILLKCLMK
jgi:hypothetical protein